MVNTTPTKNIKQVCAFVGLVNHYRDMWARRSHLLQPLTALTSTKLDFKWTDDEQKVFGKIKRIVSRNILLIYPYLNERFDIHMDASNCQLGSVIIHNGKPISCYSRKLTGAQSCYIVTEKELLSIVKTLK